MVILTSGTVREKTPVFPRLGLFTQLGENVWLPGRDLNLHPIR